MKNKNTIKDFILNNRYDLLNIFSEVGCKFNAVSTEISEREKLIENSLKQLNKLVENDPWENSELKQNHQFKTKTNKHVDKISQLIKTWVEDTENYDKRTEFRSRFGDSLLVFVFGKVKAGKSSLGNFLAYGDSQPSLAIIEEASPKPNFFWEEGNNSTETMSGDAMQKKRCFGVGIGETTSSIQGFTLPGITWVDSPGVHSKKDENEELTKKYAEAADVIVFLSNSSEPGRRSDMEEIRELLGQDKPLLVIITASDSLEDDEVNGEIVSRFCMKSAEDRQGQIDFVSQEIKTFSSKTQVLTISMKYAEDGQPNEPKSQALARWQDSGMQDFAKSLAEISVSQGVTVKRTTPLKNLKIFCQTLIGEENERHNPPKVDELHSIYELDENLKHILHMLKDERKTIDEECRNVSQKIRASLTKRIKKLADEHVMNNFAFKKSCMDAFTETCAKYEAEIGEQFISPFNGCDLRSIMQSPIFPNFEPRFESRTYTSKKAENVGKAAGTGGGAWAGAEAGAALGLMTPIPGGALIGGLLGAVFGGWLGGKAGGAVGENFNETETVQTKVGDNREEVAAEVCKALVETSEKYMIEISRKLDQLCFENLEDWIKKLQISLDNFRLKLETQINEINKELNHDIA